MRLVRVAVNVEQLLYQPPGGIGRYTAKLVTLLPRLFPDDEVLAFTALHRRGNIDAAWRRATAAAADGVRPPRPEPQRLPLPRAALYDCWNALGWPPLERLAPALGPVDVVHAPSVAVPPRGGGARLVVTVHDVAPVLFPKAFPRHGRWFHHAGLAATASRADLVITVSQAAAAEIVAHSDISPDRLRVVPNGVDHIEASPGDTKAVLGRHHLAGAPYILWVGTLEPRKDVATLVEAFSRLVDSGLSADHRLALVGPPGWLSSDLIPASVLSRLGGVNGRLRLIGPVGDAELRALYRGATLFALPSRHEGFGLPVLEAMAQGTPVACADIPALREVSGAGDACAGAARLVAPGDIDAWADALARLIGDQSGRQRLGEAGRAWSAHFSWERTIRQTRAVYTEARGGRK